MTRLSRRTVGLVAIIALLAVVAGTAGAAPVDGVTSQDGTASVALQTNDTDTPGNHTGTGTACGGGTSWVPETAEDTNDTDDARVIITYEKGSARASCAGSAVSAAGGEVLGGEEVDLVEMRVARIDPAAMEALESRPGIKSVDRDAPMRGAEFRADNETAGGTGSTHTQSVPWGIDKVNATAAAAEVTDSEMSNVQVAVMDSGIDLDHPDLSDNLVWGTDHINGNNRDGLQYTDDVYGHGTHVAGTVAALDNSEGVVGVAPNVELYSARVINESNFGWYSWWIEALDRTVKGPDGTIGTDDDPEIISMSLGGSSDCCGLHSAIQSADDHALLVASAGNEGNGDTSDNEIEYPAKYPETIAVAATEKDDLTTTFSAEGDEVDIAAPGKDVLSTMDPDLRGVSYTSWQGTSMAAPHVSGVAALIIAQDLADGSRDLSDADVKTELLDTTKDIHSSGIDRYSGHGRLQALEAMGTQSNDDPPTATVAISPNSPITGETVTFDASGSTDDNGIASYNWTIDGTQTNTTDPSVTRTFSQGGSYSASLTVVDTAGQTDTISTTLTITADDPPTAAISVDPETPVTNETVTFDASNATDDNGIAIYNWTIDGTQTNTTDPSVTQTFSQSGSYNVTLTVVDSVGQSNTTERSLLVERNDPPTAAFTFAPESPLVNDTVTLDASNTTDDAGIVSYNWTVAGTQINATDPAEKLPFSGAGTYNLTLTVVDTSGVTNTTTQTVTVTEPVAFTRPDVISPSQVNETTPVTVSVAVGDLIPNATAQSDIDLSVSLNGTVQNTTNATVTEGETTALSLPVTPGTNGTYDVTIDGSVVFNGTTYNATSAAAGMSVVAKDEPLSAPVTGSDAPTNLDNDTLLEDVDGDGQGDVIDVVTYYNNRETETIRDNPGRFDFDGDGTAGTVFDALALYEKVSS